MKRGAVPRPALARLAAGLAMAAGAAAPETVRADYDIFFGALPVVASVSRLPQRLEDAPGAVTVIDRAMIRASGARSLHEVFRLVPGFQTFTPSDKPARVNYHGVTDDTDYSPRVQVLVDGRSLHSPLFRGGMNWELVPVALDDIERIEVVRGSNTTSYGTNAFLGVINIVTVAPAFVQGWSVATRQGSGGVRDYSVRGGGALGESGLFRLSVEERADDGLDYRAVAPADRDWRDQNRSRLFDFRAEFQLAARSLLELQFGRVEARHLVGRLAINDDGTAIGPRASDPLRPSDQASTWVQARWLQTLSETADLSLRYTHHVDRLDAGFAVEGRPELGRLNPSGGRGVRHELEALHTFLPADSLRMVWGGGWRHDALESSTMLHGIGRVSRDVGRLFANMEWKPRDWFTGNVGLSHEYDSLAGEHLARRASASFHFDGQNTVRLGYVRAWRTPGTLDYTANQIDRRGQIEWAGNPALPAEGLDSWELGYLGDWSAARMSLDVRVFRERLSDRQIHRIRTTATGPDTVQAVHDLEIRGQELQWKWQPVDATRIVVGHAHVDIDAGFSAIGSALNTTTGSNFAGPARAALYFALSEQSAPRRATSLLWMQRLPLGLDLSVARYWVHDIKWTRNTETDSYNRTDLRLAYPIKGIASGGEIAYTVQSLNGAHAEERMERIVGRQHWLSLRLDF
ncbi:TonB-dependent receptor plug domain-containing protein [Thauera sp. ZXT1-4]|uniref:TonB-dependent receptor plug domain-containing protein n=1 Tax=Thauera sp. ZXT1-4 TaxID=3460294 RepID=UPI004040A27B